MLNIRPSIELCCLVVFDLSCNDLFASFSLFCFFLLLLPLMANKVVCESLCVVCYSSSIVTMAVSVAVCQLFSVEEWFDLKNRVRVQGH